MKRLQRVAPHINGFPLPPHDLELPHSTLDTTRHENWNNHHGMFYARTFGRLAITQTLRDLSTYQYQIPKDVHNVYHQRYSPSPVPDLVDIMDVLDDAYERQIPLRYGSANLPTFSLISTELRRIIHSEYNSLNG